MTEPMSDEEFAIAVPAMKMIAEYMRSTDTSTALAVWERAEQIAMAAGESCISVAHVEQAMREGEQA